MQLFDRFAWARSRSAELPTQDRSVQAAGTAMGTLSIADMFAGAVAMTRMCSLHRDGRKCGANCHCEDYL